MKSILLLVALLIMPTYQSAQPQAEAQKLVAKNAARIGDGDYEVYNVIIGSVFVKNNDRSIIILDETMASTAEDYSINDFFKILKEQIPAINKETFLNYNDLNKTSFKLDDAFTGQVNHKLIGKGDYDKYFSTSDGDWPRFFKHNPNTIGVLKLSRIGFNPAHNQALLYLSFSCGFECGVGKFYVLTREQNNWQISGDYLVWHS